MLQVVIQVDSAHVDFSKGIYLVEQIKHDVHPGPNPIHVPYSAKFNYKISPSYRDCSRWLSLRFPIRECLLDTPPGSHPSSPMGESP